MGAALFIDGPMRADRLQPRKPGLGSPLPHLRWDWAHPCHICTGIGHTVATSAPGLDIARQFSMGTEVLEMSLERERF